MSTIDITTANLAQTIRTGTVLIDCWASWCGPCRAFAPVYEAAAAKHPELTFAKVDTEAQPELAAAFRIQAIPTLMVFRDGVLLFREAGMLPPAALETLIERVSALDMDEVRREIAQAEARSARPAAE